MRPEPPAGGRPDVGRPALLESWRVKYRACRAPPSRAPSCEHGRSHSLATISDPTRAESCLDETSSSIWNQSGRRPRGRRGSATQTRHKQRAAAWRPTLVHRPPSKASTTAVPMRPGRLTQMVGRWLIDRSRVAPERYPWVTVGLRQAGRRNRDAYRQAVCAARARRRPGPCAHARTSSCDSASPRGVAGRCCSCRTGRLPHALVSGSLPIPRSELARPARL